MAKAFDLAVMSVCRQDCFGAVVTLLLSVVLSLSFHYVTLITLTFFHSVFLLSHGFHFAPMTSATISVAL